MNRQSVHPIQYVTPMRDDFTTPRNQTPRASRAQPFAPAAPTHAPRKFAKRFGVPTRRDSSGAFEIQACAPEAGTAPEFRVYAAAAQTSPPAEFARRPGVRQCPGAFHVYPPTCATFRFSRSCNACFTSAMIIPLVCSTVIPELLMTRAPSATINGAAARWLSRSSRAAKFS